MEGENIVAVCDIDDRLLAAAKGRFPKAKGFDDFRKLIGMGGLDAVVISTADHTHAPASAMALRTGLHVYCEKPLTHSVYEARVVARLAKESKLATQMGTQIHADRQLPAGRRAGPARGRSARSARSTSGVNGKPWSNGVEADRLSGRPQPT